MDREYYIKKLNTIKEAGNYRVLRNIEHNGFLVHVDGKEMLNLSSNDYLGLASNPRLAEEFRLEMDTAAYGHDLVIADKLVHASIIDGLRLCEAEMMRYRHLDYEHLRSLLLQHREEYGNVFIVTESIFSMDGDIADLQQLCEIKKEFDAFLYVDEAHAVGVRGTNGLGCCEEQGCMEDIDFIVGTFGKAFASMGAFVVCEDLFRDYLVNTQRSLIFTTALPPVNVAWTRFILNRMPDFYDLRIKLAGISRKLREILVAKGFETRGDSHIVPMICGSNENSVEMAGLLQDNGFFALPVRYPTVPKNEARIRFSLNASIGMEDYECLFEFLECLE